MPELTTTTSNGSEMSTATGMFGIKGGWHREIMNMSGMSIIAIVFMFQFKSSHDQGIALQKNMVEQQKEDRDMFREELTRLRTAQESRWERTEVVHGKSMEKMSSTIERSVSAMESAVGELKKANEKIRTFTSPPGTSGGGP